MPGAVFILLEKLRVIDKFLPPATLVNSHKKYNNLNRLARWFPNPQPSPAPESTLRDVRLEWEPGFVDASAAGDMGYTYRPYQFSAVDTGGQEIRATGVFHTVWKKQADGEWKFVYD